MIRGFHNFVKQRSVRKACRFLNYSMQSRQLEIIEICFENVLRYVLNFIDDIDDFLYKSTRIHQGSLATYV